MGRCPVECEGCAQSRSRRVRTASTSIVTDKRLRRLWLARRTVGLLGTRGWIHRSCPRSLGACLVSTGSSRGTRGSCHPTRFLRGMTLGSSHWTLGSCLTSSMSRGLTRGSHRVATGSSRWTHGSCRPTQFLRGLTLGSSHRTLGSVHVESGDRLRPNGVHLVSIR